MHIRDCQVTTDHTKSQIENKGSPSVHPPYSAIVLQPVGLHSLVCYSILAYTLYSTSSIEFVVYFNSSKLIP
jgi:hypothetical protein